MALSKDEIVRQHDAAVNSWKAMRRFRQTSLRYMKHFCGHAYSGKKPSGGSGSEDGIVIINRLQQNIMVLLRMLSSRNPNVLVEAELPLLRPFAHIMELDINKKVRVSGLADAVRGCLYNTFFDGLGVMKTGLRKGGQVYAANEDLIDTGTPFFRPVTFSNFVMDMQAESLDSCEFYGDRYLRDKKWVEKKYKLHKKGGAGTKAWRKFEKELAAIENRSEGQFKPNERISGVEEKPDKRLTEQVWVWDIYRPRDNRLITIPEGATKALADREWKGPGQGPYDFLSLIEAPGEAMPIPTASIYYSLDRINNELIVKLGDQSSRQKNILIMGDVAAQEAADRIRESSDGEIIRVNQAAKEDMQEVKFGGADPMMHNVIIWAMETLGKMGLNTDALGGLQPQSETATQDHMLSTAANAQIDDMARAVESFTQNIVRRWADYLWRDHARKIQVVVNAEGIQLPVELQPLEREGNFEDFDFSIATYSMREKTPLEKGANLLQFVTQFAIPTMPMAQQAGLVLDIVDISKRLAKYFDLEFDIVYKTLSEQQQEQALGGGMPSNTIRTYERVSRPGTSPHGNNIHLQQANARVAAAQGAS